jgi:uncharacterized OsmC-like protein
MQTLAPPRRWGRASFDAAGRTLATDMPAELGGSGSAPTPGTLLRAALASWAATTVAMVAAEQGSDSDRLRWSRVRRRSERRPPLPASRRLRCVLTKTGLR